MEIGQNVVINGIVGSNRHITSNSGSKFLGGIRAVGSMNPGGIASQNAEIGSVLIATDALVNQNFNFNGQVYGNVHAGGNVLLGASADVNKVGGLHGNVYAGGNITFNASGPIIQGNAAAGGTISGPGTVQGTSSASNGGTVPGLLSFSGVTMPAQTAFSSGGTSYDLTGALTSVDLMPDSYGTLSGGSSRSVTLHSGNYYFDSISFTSGFSLYLDLTSNQMLNIFVTGDVSFGSNMLVFVDQGSGWENAASLANHDIASLVYLETHGQFSMASGGQWLGTIFASEDVTPAAPPGNGNREINIGQNNTIWGALYSVDQVDIASGSTINYVRTGYAGLLPANNGDDDDNGNPGDVGSGTAVPEPMTAGLALLALGGAGLATFRRRRS